MFNAFSDLVSKVNFDDLQSNLDPNLLTPQERAAKKQQQDEQQRKREAAEATAEQARHASAAADEEAGDGDWGWGDEDTKPAAEPAVKTAATTNSGGVAGLFGGFQAPSLTAAHALLGAANAFSLDGLQRGGGGSDDGDRGGDDSSGNSGGGGGGRGLGSRALLSGRSVAAAGGSGHVAALQRALEEAKELAASEGEQRKQFQEMVGPNSARN
jgi:hypothetical protein